MARAEQDEKKLLAEAEAAERERSFAFNSFWKKPGLKPVSTRQRSQNFRQPWMRPMQKQSGLGRWPK